MVTYRILVPVPVRPVLFRGGVFCTAIDLHKAHSTFNETTREQDEKRILWTAGDLVENRPALSRWHPDFAQAFQEFMSMGRS